MPTIHDVEAAPHLTARIGAVRSSHPALPWPRRFIKPILLGLILSVTGVLIWTRVGDALGLVMLGAAPFAALLYAAPALRRGEPHLTLHAEGVVSRGRGYDAVAFEDVDEVWFVFERSGRFAPLRGLRLVDTVRVAHLISLEVENGVTLCNAILRACSLRLLPEARRALAQGEPLVFGEVRLTAESISFRGGSIAWKELRLVRMLPGSIAFFRRQPVFPWRTVCLDEIPHPSVFMRLVRAHAVRLELDPLVQDEG